VLAAASWDRIWTRMTSLIDQTARGAPARRVQTGVQLA
jgi:hypothetical protein